MSNVFNVSSGRRSFLKAAGVASASLVVGFYFDPRKIVGQAVASQSASLSPNAWVVIKPDSTVTILCKHLEFGQGPFTGFATIIADELDASWGQIKVEHAPSDVTKYSNDFLQVQGTGGSTAMADSFEKLRKVGAQCRAMLLEAAAQSWKVPANEITIQDGILSHKSGRSGKFGDFADQASRIVLKAEAKPKDPSQWRYIGKSFPRVDSAVKSNGEAKFTIDIILPDMLTCVIARPSRFGAKPVSFDATEALKVKGVVEAFAVPQGIAVLAKGYWQARKGANAIKAVWDESGTEARSTADMTAHYAKLAKTQGVKVRNEGDVGAALSKGVKTIEATYTFPYLAHAPLEPNDCVIRRTEKGVELSFGSQLQTVDQGAAAAILGLKPEQVEIKTMFAGGSFGRRATPGADMAVEAAFVLKNAKHKGPIKIIWSREDDIKGGRYRPLFVHNLKGSVDAQGNIVAWDHVIVGDSFIFGSPFESFIVKNGVDTTMVEGGSTLPYAIPNLRVSVHHEKAGVPTLWWRSVGSTHTGYSTETFFDELAAAAGVDEVELRRKLLAKHPRHLAVLNLAVEKAGWGTPLPKGKARGVAVHESFNSFVSHVVEVSIGERGLPKVERCVVAVDCGVAVNPDVIRAQMEGGAGFGLSAALFNAIDLEDGRVVQSNFHDYRQLRIDEMPKVEVHIVPSREKPTGVGEPGVPSVAPAVANAWAKLTGERVHQLPFIRTVAKA